MEGSESLAGELVAMNIWDNIKDTYSSLEPSDIWNFGSWMQGAPTEWDIPNYTNVSPAAFGGVTGWGASPDEKRRLGNQMEEGINNASMGLGMTGGFTKMVGKGPSKMIEAWHNEIPNLKVGQLGYSEAPGFNALKDIKVDPAYRGQGYGKEMMDTFFQQGAEPRFGGTITNSPNFWSNLKNTTAEKYPKFSQGIDTALNWAKQDFGWR